MEKTFRTYYKSPIGVIEIKGIKRGITSVEFVEEGSLEKMEEYTEEIYPIINKCKSQLREYFMGQRKKFQIEIILSGTDFQNKVWNELIKVPFGTTVSYKYIAEAIGNNRAFRAVGGANNRNPISIIVPCHRVIGTNGTLTGYEGGLWRKKWLIDHEKKFYKLFY